MTSIPRFSGFYITQSSNGDTRIELTESAEMRKRQNVYKGTRFERYLDRFGIEADEVQFNNAHLGTSNLAGKLSRMLSGEPEMGQTKQEPALNYRKEKAFEKYLKKLLVDKGRLDRSSSDTNRLMNNSVGSLLPCGGELHSGSELRQLLQSVINDDIDMSSADEKVAKSPARAVVCDFADNKSAILENLKNAKFFQRVSESSDGSVKSLCFEFKAEDQNPPK